MSGKGSRFRTYFSDEGRENFDEIFPPRQSEEERVRNKALRDAKVKPRKAIERVVKQCNELQKQTDEALIKNYPFVRNVVFGK